MIKISSWTDGDAKWFFKPVTVTPGKVYRFSDYYRSSVPTSVIAEFHDAAGGRSWQKLGTAPKSAAWRVAEFTFAAPANAAAITVLHTLAAAGTLETDNYSLIETVPPEFRRALVSVMFDDGYKSVHENAWPVLRRYRIKSTHYIISDAIGSATWFAHPLMSAAEIRDLYQDGNEIGSHSATHVKLSKLSPVQLKSQLTKSWKTLNTQYPPVTGLAFPYGDYDDAVAAACGKYYSYCRTSDPGFNARFNYDPYRIRIQYVLSTTPLSEVKEWLAKAAREKSWLAVLYHNVDNSEGDEYSVSPETFAAQLGAIHDSGLTVLTVRQALDELSPQVRKRPAQR
jgi:peptidoglycan/xylan/chitin deacetylase (PgdA/CDA1 family)